MSKVYLSLITFQISAFLIVIRFDFTFLVVSRKLQEKYSLAK